MDQPEEKSPNKLPEPRFAAGEGEQVIIETTVPIPVTTLKRKFTENVKFVVDYDNSKFKGKVLITYLTNLNVACELKFASLESKLALLKEYLHLTALVDLPELEDIVINLLLAASGRLYRLDFNPVEFINENREILEVWMRNVCMTPVYALHSYPQTVDEVKKYEEIPGEDLRGINFVHLLSHIQFPVLMMNLPEQDWCWNKLFFEEYCFAGNNLFYYFQSENNPFFMGLLVLTEPDHVGDLHGATERMLEANLTYLKGIEHVPSV